MALTHASHHQLMYIFGILGNIVSLGVFLAPLPTFWRVFKKKSTEGFQAIPYSVALFSCMLLLYYAMLKTDNAMPIITINSVGFVIEAFYLIVFLIYAPTKTRVYTMKLLGLFNVTFLGLIIGATMIFARGSDEHTIFSKGGVRETSVGWICAVFSVCVFAAPLSVMKMVIKTKSVEFMPFCLSFSLTLCAVMWFFYGFLIQDYYIAMPNVLGFLLGITQMLLYIIYKNSSPKNNQKNHMINESDMKQLEAELGIEIIKLNNNNNNIMDKINNNNNNKEQEMIMTNPNEVVEIIVHDINKGDNNDTIMAVDGGGGDQTVDIPPRV